MGFLGYTAIVFATGRARAWCRYVQRRDSKISEPCSNPPMSFTFIAPMTRIELVYLSGSSSDSTELHRGRSMVLDVTPGISPDPDGFE